MVPYPLMVQFQYVGLFVDVSVKDTDTGEIPVVTPTGVKDATGAGNWLTFTHATCVLMLLPAVPFTPCLIL